MKTWPCDVAKCDCERIAISREPEKWISLMAIAEHKKTGEDAQVVIERLVSNQWKNLRGDRPLDINKFHKRLQTENLKKIISEEKEKVTGT